MSEEEESEQVARNASVALVLAGGLSLAWGFGLMLGAGMGLIVLGGEMAALGALLAAECKKIPEKTGEK